MTEENNSKDHNLNEIIKKIIEQAIKNGNFPFDGKFSVTIAGGRLPVEMLPSNCDKCKNDNSKFDEHEPVINTPHTEIHKSGDDIMVYANIPGSDMSNTAVSVHENIILINSFTDGIKHSAEVKIPPVKKETMRYKFNNGLVFIKF